MAISEIFYVAPRARPVILWLSRGGGGGGGGTTEVNTVDLARAEVVPGCL